MAISIPIERTSVKPVVPTKTPSWVSFFPGALSETIGMFLGYQPGRFPEEVKPLEKVTATIKEIPGAVKEVGKEIIKAPFRLGATIVDPWVNFAMGQPLVPKEPLKIPLLGEVPTLQQQYNKYTEAGFSPLEAGLMSGSQTAMDLAISAGMAKFFLHKVPVKVGKKEFVATVEKGKPTKMTLGEPLKTKPIVKEAKYFKLGENGIVETIPTTSKTMKVNIYDVSKTSFQRYTTNLKAQLQRV